MYTIKPHTSAPTDFVGFLGKPVHKIFYGVELELEATHPPKGVGNRLTSLQAYLGEVADKIVNLLGKDFMVIKRDGSLNFGLELVTAPSAMTIQQRRWPKLYENLTTLGLAPTRTCGMHVHYSRGPLSKASIGAQAAFVTDPANAKLIHAVARRKAPLFAALHKKDPNCWTLLPCFCHDAEGCTHRGLPTYNSRYDALNITGEQTCELRIFQAPKTWEHFKINLEFTAALVRYFLTDPAADRRAVVFAQWVSSKPKMFPTLAPYLAALKFSSSEGDDPLE